MSMKTGDGGLKYRIRRKRGVNMPATVKKGYFNKYGLATKIQAPVAQIEQALGLDKVKPIILTSSGNRR
jgi:hypothetical protein